MTEPTMAIEAHGLFKRYGRRTAVDGVDLAIPAGSIYGVLGPNGAGKSTTLRMILGVIEPDEGGRTVLGARHPRDVVGRVGFLPEERSLYQNMSARDAIGFMGAMRGLAWRDARTRGEKMMERFGLGDLTRSRIRRMSKGQAQLIQLICSIVHAPDLIVLDEPFSGLDPVNQGIMERIILEERARGATILFSTHVLGHAERMCERIVIIGGGRVRFEGTVDEARSILPGRIRWRPEHDPSAVSATMPEGSLLVDGEWTMAPGTDASTAFDAITASGLGITSLSIEKASLHDAFVRIIGEQPEDER